MTYTTRTSDNGKMILKEQLTYLLDQEKISLSFLANETGIPVQTLHNWLNGVAPRGLNQLKKVSDFFGITIDELCFGTFSKSDTNQEPFINYKDEINAGTFEVVLRRVRP